MVAKPEIVWIGTDGDFYPDRRDPYTGQQYSPVAIVCHIMEGTLAGTDQEFHNPKRNASTHFGIGRDGTIHQYVDLKDGAWGNGGVAKPSWPLLDQFPGVNPNLFTVSIEFAGMHPDMDRGKFDSFTDAQYAAGAQLIAWLCQELSIPIDRAHIVGHYQIDSVNKWFCPGPNFDFDRIIKEAQPAMLSVEDANKIIKFLVASYNATTDPEAQAEFHRLANELRKASGQDPQ